MLTTITLVALVLLIGWWALRVLVRQHLRRQREADGHARLVRSIAAMEYMKVPRRWETTHDDDREARRGRQWSPRRPPIR